MEAITKYFTCVLYIDMSSSIILQVALVIVYFAMKDKVL